MATNKTRKFIFYAALVMMLVIGVLLILHYTGKESINPISAWLLMAAMALTAIGQLILIRDSKKKGGE